MAPFPWPSRTIWFDAFSRPIFMLTVELQVWRTLCFLSTLIHTDRTFPRRTVYFVILVTLCRIVLICALKIKKSNMRVTFLIIISLLFLSTVVLAKKDYYEILGVDRRASKKEIKTAYKKLSKIHHPDKNNGKQDVFIELSNGSLTLLYHSPF